MKKSVIFCLALVCSFGFVGMVSAISEEQRIAIVEKCDVIRDDLKSVQRIDARARTFLGSHFETALSKFVMPLNIRLVENNLSDLDLIENQNEFATAKAGFVVDFISYQQELESLIAMNCRTEPELFYEKLKVVRDKRKIVASDVTKMKGIVTRNLKLVTGLKEGLK